MITEETAALLYIKSHHTVQKKYANGVGDGRSCQSLSLAIDR